MIIGNRLRLMREAKNLSQGDVEKRTRLLRCYISRVENGHTVPAVKTIEKFAWDLEVPMYQLFSDGDKPPELPNLPKRKTADEIAWGKLWQGRALPFEFPKNPRSCRREGQKTPNVFRAETSLEAKRTEVHYCVTISRPARGSRQARKR